MWFVDSIASESKSLYTWRKTSKPSSVERIRAVSLSDSRLNDLITNYAQMLEVAKAIRYLHGFGIVFGSTIGLVCIKAHLGKIYQGDMLSG
jgi:hypothetical protein